MAKMTVLGAGRVGEAIAWDLARRGHSVRVVDAASGPLERIAARASVETVRADLTSPAAIAEAVAGADVAIGALPSVLGLAALKAVAQAGVHCVDISFMGEDPRVHDAIAREHGVCAVVDCGVAPGMSHILSGHAAAHMDRCDTLAIYVGGLPVARHAPYAYKAPFAPYDVLEEYTRPARVVVGGGVRVVEALSGVEPLEVPGLGTLEAFTTDGLRTLVDTVAVPDMVEKTLRYPGHCALMLALRQTGLLGEAAIDVRGQSVVPRELLSALLFPKWSFDEREPDLTFMRVEAKGEHQGRAVTWTWDLFDRYDPEANLRSMSRTTGFPAAIIAELIASGGWREPGVHPPEVLGQRGLLGQILRAHEERGVYYAFSERVS